jgi:hypothetical protein
MMLGSCGVHCDLRSWQVISWAVNVFSFRRGTAGFIVNRNFVARITG